jgi:hypothetical protein
MMVCLSLFIGHAMANSPGTLVKKTGKVEIYINPDKKVTGPGPHVLYESVYYTVVNDPKLGYKIPNESIIKTGTGAKAKIIFPDGDQFNLGEATAFKYSWSSSKKGKDEASIGMIFGKLRAVISKEGPRNNMKIKTPSAVMGVRGTDFFVNQPGLIQPTKLAVLRGQVQMTANLKDAKPVEVKSGVTAEVNVQKPEIKSSVVGTESVLAGKVAEIKLEETSKQELAVIQKESVIRKEEIKEEVPVTQELAKSIEKLEKQAVETTLTDIKVYDPKLYEELKKQEVASVDTINTNVVKEKYEEAPSRPLKAGWDDLNEIGNDAYDRYFKVE